MSKKIRTGIFSKLSRLEYEKIDAINFSSLKHFDDTPEDAKINILHPKPPTRSMEFGNGIHLSILEPERLEHEYVKAPHVDRRTKEGKAEWAKFEVENEGKSYLTEIEWQNCIDIVKKTQSHETARQIISGKGANELTVVWQDEETGVMCKGRVDRFTQFMGWSVIVDIKSTKSVKQSVFASQCAKMQYHVQAAMYFDGLNTVSKSEHERRYLFWTIQNSPPFHMRFFELDDDAMIEGRNKYKHFLRLYKECKKTNIWPGYPTGIEPLSLPSWAVNNIYNTEESEETND